MFGLGVLGDRWFCGVVGGLNVMFWIWCVWVK